MARPIRKHHEKSLGAKRVTLKALVGGVHR